MWGYEQAYILPEDNHSCVLFIGFWMISHQNKAIGIAFAHSMRISERGDTRRTFSSLNSVKVNTFIGSGHAQGYEA